MPTQAPENSTNSVESAQPTDAQPGPTTAPLLPHHAYVYIARGPWPHLRHIARLNTVTYPTGYFDTGSPVIEGELAITLCGQFLRDYWEGGNMSALASDGSQYLIECARCATRQQAAVERWKANLAELVNARGVSEITEEVERR